MKDINVTIAAALIGLTLAGGSLTGLLGNYAVMGLVGGVLCLCVMAVRKILKMVGSANAQAILFALGISGAFLALVGLYR